MRYLRPPLLTLLILLILPCTAGMEFSEIMFDDVGNDDTLEYIELIGTQTLEGCQLSDSSSSDILELIQEGDEIILILEEDSPYLDLTSPTIYSAGKAIGNGLGNQEDNITIVCPDFILKTAYTRPESFVAGQSIHWNETWIPGNKTPGTSQNLADNEDELIEEIRPGRHRICNDTLLLIVDKVVEVNRTFEFTILTEWYASWDVYADGDLISYGDTYHTNKFTLIPPKAEEMKIVAQSNACGAIQRSVRIVQVEPPRLSVSRNFTNASITNTSQDITAVDNTTVDTNNIVSANSAINTRPVVNKTSLPVITSNVVYESEPNLVPWLSSFGIVVILASGWAFWYAAQDEKSI